MKEYPECVEVKAASFDRSWSNVPFIQEVAPLLKQESEIQQEQEWLLPAAAMFLACTQSLNLTKVGEVFEMWATQRVESLRERVGERIGEIR